MNVNEYKSRVRALLESGKATPKQWDEALEAILWASEDEQGCFEIDKALGLVAEEGE